MAQTGLTGEQFEQLQAAIISAFPIPGDLGPPIRFAFNLNLYTIVTQVFPLNRQVFQLIEWADANDKVRELVRALRRPNANPGNKLLKAFDEEFNGKESLDKVLEKLIGQNPVPFADPEAWRAAMTRAESAVCRIENPAGTAIGTGFLIGPDLVLTNQHVREEAAFDTNPGGARFRFGYRTRGNQGPDDGTLHELATNWNIHSSAVEHFDYAIVRLAAKAGEEPMGSFVNAPMRGWLTAGANQPAAHQTLFILQHPKGDTLKVAPGVLKVNENGWLEYAVDTEKGSSGSPVLDSLWALVALHSRAGTGVANRGVSMAAIRADLPDDVKVMLKQPQPK
jgi:V8-like Glu-specific endopeptidase